MVSSGMDCVTAGFLKSIQTACMSVVQHMPGDLQHPLDMLVRMSGSQQVGTGAGGQTIRRWITRCAKPHVSSSSFTHGSGTCAPDRLPSSALHHSQVSLYNMLPTNSRYQAACQMLPKGRRIAIIEPFYKRMQGGLCMSGEAALSPEWLPQVPHLTPCMLECKEGSRVAALLGTSLQWVAGSTPLWPAPASHRALVKAQHWDCTGPTSCTPCNSGKRCRPRGTTSAWKIIFPVFHCPCRWRAGRAC
jgi:hypothetical protein